MDLKWNTFHDIKRSDGIIIKENAHKNLDELSPLTLAFIGDAVFELMVRLYITKDGSMPVSKLHEKTVEFVKASSQYKQTLLLEDVFSEEEKIIFKRGRNVSSNHIPKNVTPKEYRAATALEALFGYLYFKNEHERLRYLFEKITKGT